MQGRNHLAGKIIPGQLGNNQFNFRKLIIPGVIAIIDRIAFPVGNLHGNTVGPDVFHSPHFGIKGNHIRISVFTRIHIINQGLGVLPFLLVSQVFREHFSLQRLQFPFRLHYSAHGGNRQTILHTIHKSLLPIGIFHVGRDIVHLSISGAGGSFAVHIVIMGASGSPAIRVKGRDSHPRFILGQRDHRSIKGLTYRTSAGIQRFHNFNLIHTQIFIHLDFGNSVEIGGFRMHQPPCLITGCSELLLNGGDSLGRWITPQHTLNQFFVYGVHQISLVHPTAIPESPPVRCPRL